MSFNSSFIFDAIDKLTPHLEKIAKHFEKLDKAVEISNKKLKEASIHSKTFRGRLEKIAKSSKLANNSIVRLAAGYLSLRAAINFGKDLIQTQVKIQNIDAALKAVTGSQMAATAEFNFLRKSADDLGVSFENIISPYTKYIAASKDTVEVNRKVFTSFLKTGRVLGLSSEKFKSIFIALEQIQSKGKLASQELRVQLGDAIPGAFDLFAQAAIRASNGQIKNTTEFTKFLEQGKIGAGILEKVAEILEEKFGKSAVEASKTLGAEIGRLQSAFFFLKKELSTGIFSRTIASAVVFLTNNLKVLSQVILSIGAIVAIMKFPVLIVFFKAIGASIALAVIALTGFTAVITGVALAFALLFINWKSFRDDFLTVAGFIGDKLKEFGNNKLVGGLIGDLFGKNKFEQDIKRSGNFTTNNNVGFNGTLNIKNAPAGSTAKLTPFGSNNPNLGLNMSFAPNGGI